MKDPLSSRISNLPPYVFARINQLKAQARAAGKDIIDLGMGNPDLPTPPHIVEKLTEVAHDPKAHRYSASQGIRGLRRAIVDWYAKRFGADLDPDREVVAVIGSKEGLCHFALAAFEPGEAVLVPNPTYPIHLYSFAIAGVGTVDLPLLPENGFLPDLGRINLKAGPRPKALLLSFPHNPTTSMVGLDYLAEAVDFCRRNDLFLIHDLAYGELVFDGRTAPSVLQVPGAKEVAIEFYSLSKTYCMAGWRVGFAVGNPQLVGALIRLKSYYDYGIFTPIQVAAAAALRGPQDCVVQARETYQARRDLLVDRLARAGWEVPRPPATMYIWAPLPEKFRAMGSMDFAAFLLERAEVVVSPGVGFGRYGERYVRLALVENEQRLRQAARNIAKALQ
ncbi:MAG TPA: aminotransferase class I/II-fold pyridoxal phosphate-dependent enzyme [bacterium]|nr:aminotransferase class I/II-fold pyridoxal phosphate-dependent enzyme [bacterium]HNS48746.1 aminotransferase class I/II-fold pyridoxal phosphate-dependent enzyme [bacterium]